MPLVEVKCTNCGQTLRVDDSKDAAICEFCGSAFIVEKAINNYNSYNQYHIEHADISMSDEKSVQNRLNNAEVFLNQLNQPEKAKSLFRSVTEDAPGDYRGWWGVARVLTKEFSLTGCSQYELEEIQKNVTNAISVAPPDKKDELQGIWNSQLSILDKYFNKKNLEISEMEAQLETLKRAHYEKKQKLDWIQKQIQFESDSQMKPRGRNLFDKVFYFFCFVFGADILLLILIQIFNRGGIIGMIRDYPKDATIVISIGVISSIILALLLAVSRHDGTRVINTRKQLDEAGWINQVNSVEKEIRDLEQKIAVAKSKLQSDNLNVL